MKSQRKLERERVRREASRQRPRTASRHASDDNREAELGDALDLQIARSVRGYDE